MIHFFFIVFITFSNAEPHSVHRHCIASQGVSYHKHIQFVMLDDHIIYYYNSSSDLGTPMPEWLNHSEGSEFWKKLTRNLKYNRHVMEKAVQLTSERFNHSHDHLYQAQGHCGWNSDGTRVALMSHAYDGKDFISFDVQTKQWTAVVPEARFYKTSREQNSEDLDRITNHYESECILWLKKLLQFGSKLLKSKAPDVSLFERSSSSEVEVTCHVTGFYPREVQVEWLDEEGHPLVQGVRRGEVLPNEDATYQLRTSLAVPLGSKHSLSYSCLVVHSSVQGNITRIWEPKHSRIWNTWSISISICLLLCSGLVAVGVIFVRNGHCLLVRN
ncbi:major histocompatibility complex class I-related gene protein-like [Osmerus mordax]|uniref:major histocompatibility complex class I-related gene protein-like n=1 Tax=Osmerus mordax TaxID=8014 RepID=UPI0035105F5B